eukprot:TRINITY_DN39448_c0_g1_i1.p1 TRINITY_DN39448_c0_g1~~TRINITY_DN39448_c0_g1_i1.p1  ORF type:complete len:233 (-),score=70.94 TRINITY_DN39448_c0_g1_i1:51-749(-)
MVRSGTRCAWAELVAALLLGHFRSVLGVSKDAVAAVQCEVCNLAMREGKSYAEENALTSEDDLSDMVEAMCSVGKNKKAGRWVSKLDIVREDTDSPLSLVSKEDVGHCRQECLIIQKACKAALKGKEDTLVELLAKKASLADMKKKICKKTCSKKVPNVKDFKDEVFEARDQKEVETEDMMEKMKKETGMGMKMYKREDLLSMSEGDMETMAAREAFASERQAARMAEKSDL